MYFSYAFLDAERTRGIPADKNVIDEVQDMNFDFLQIIHETLSGSPWGLMQYAGTPKSLDNTMERLWTDSSQAEWVMKCRTAGCGHWNVPALSHDLFDMIGPWHREISQDNPAVVCAKCRKPLDPRRGRWVHSHPERRWSFAGYHVPQIIMPMHYGDPEKWDVLVGKMQGRKNTTPTTFLNEVCGESCDAGSKLVTVTDLKAAAVLPWQNRIKDFMAKVPNLRRRYTHRVLAIDWGGGGGRLGNSKKRGEDERLRTSYTTYAALGMRPDGKVECFWGHRSLRTHDYEYEARLAVEAMIKLQLHPPGPRLLERRRGPAPAHLAGRRLAQQHPQPALRGRRPGPHDLPPRHRGRPQRLVRLEPVDDAGHDLPGDQVRPRPVLPVRPRQRRPGGPPARLPGPHRREGR
jgi:hypothetical protein